MITHLVREEIQEFGRRYQDGDAAALSEFVLRFGHSIRRIIRRAVRVKARRTVSPFERQVIKEADLLMRDSSSRAELDSVLVSRVCEVVMSRSVSERPPELTVRDTSPCWEVCTVN
ncbi:MAG: hypothetical protein O3A00_00490 [Planctomycetota bacterium]|nr:hypothetical protein [Planctomycetota bacterium]